MKRIRVALPPLVVLASAAGVWYVFSYVFLEPSRRFLLPPPHRVVDVALLDSNNLRELLTGLWATARVSFVGLVIAILIGVGFAVFMSRARWIERSFYPYAVVLQTVPILALVPVIGFWFGYNFRSRVTVCVIISLFPIITNTLFGIQSVDSSHHDLFTLGGADRWTRLQKLEFPSALPAIFTGFRISAGLSVIGAIVGEFFFRQGFVGIGRLIDKYFAALETEKLFGAVFFSSLLGLGFFWSFGILGRLLLRNWQDARQ